MFLLLTVGYLSASSLVVWLLLTYSEDPQEPWLPAHTRHHLVTATVRPSQDWEETEPWCDVSGAGLPLWPPDCHLFLPVSPTLSVRQDRGELHRPDPPRHGDHQSRDE